jgi:hypothetical protein
MGRVYNEGNPGHIIGFLCVENPHRWAMELEWRRYGFKGSRNEGAVEMTNAVQMPPARLSDQR